MISEPDGSGAGSFAVAVALLVAGLATASLSGAFLKLMSAELNVAVMTFGRYAGYLVVLLPIAAWRYGRQVVLPPGGADPVPARLADPRGHAELCVFGAPPAVGQHGGHPLHLPVHCCIAVAVVAGRARRPGHLVRGGVRFHRHPDRHAARPGPGGSRCPSTRPQFCLSWGRSTRCRTC